MNATTSTTDTVPLIIRLLEPKQIIGPDDLEGLRETLRREKTTLEELLIHRNLASDRDIAAAYSEFYLIPLYELNAETLLPDASLRDLLSEKLCRDHLIVPTACNDQSVDIAFFAPSELLLIDELQLLTEREIRPFFAPLSVIERLLAALYDEDDQWSLAATGSVDAEFREMDEDSDEESSRNALDEVLHLDQPPPPGRDGRIIRYVNHIFEQALRSRASDVHVEPFESRCRIRLRVDGSLNEIAPPPISMYNAIVSRIKVLAKMDIAEKRLPQDGAIAIRNDLRRVDLRVNTCPTVYGEKIVLRVLDKNAVPLDLAGLGLDDRQRSDLAESIQAPHGMMLVTGPTGSGKSTTLYACLHTLNDPDVNICTVEDPVEYKFMGINQVQTRSQIGLDFASVLRSFLRQDPDVIMVGEIRDGETAQICMRAALTGHFVLSTLHTNDALSAVARLADMGIEPFLLASTLRVVVAQRLLRRLCPHCRQPNVLDPESAARLRLPEATNIYRARGCKECREKGYRGRLGTFEVIRITQRLANMIQAGAPLAELRRAAVEEGVKLLSQSAMSHVCEGWTSLEEALSTTISEEEETAG